MSNIFIKETKKFYNYIISTHCKDFKNEYNNFQTCTIFDHITFTFSSKKKQKQALEKLYSVLRNNEFVKIRKYIYKESPEEDKFNNWAALLKDFAEYIVYFIDPALLNTDDKISAEVSKDLTKLTYTDDNFIFYIQFEKSKIKKGNTSLFDTITGLDKDNLFSFIKIKVTNNISGKTYEYKYMEDLSLISEDDLDDDICDMQLEFIKSKLDEYIYLYIGIVFDNIVNRELNLTVDTFNVFNSYYIKNMYKEMEDQWIENMNMESN